MTLYFLALIRYAWPKAPYCAMSVHLSSKASLHLSGLLGWVSMMTRVAIGPRLGYRLLRKEPNVYRLLCYQGPLSPMPSHLSFLVGWLQLCIKPLYLFCIVVLSPTRVNLATCRTLVRFCVRMSLFPICAQPVGYAILTSLFLNVEMTTDQAMLLLSMATELMLTL